MHAPQSPGTVVGTHLVADFHGIAPEQFAHVLRTLPHLGFRGANITVPHKDAALAGHLTVWRYTSAVVLSLDLVSGRLKLSQINEGFAALQKGGVARNVIVFDQ